MNSYYARLVILFDNEFEPTTDITLESIIRFIAKKDYDLPIECESVILDIDHNTFSVNWGKYYFYIDVNKSIRDQGIDTHEDLYEFFTMYMKALNSP